MTKTEIIEAMKAMFIEKFGVNKEIKLNIPICLNTDCQSGSTYLSKIRYNGQSFEWYKEDWMYGWQTTQGPINKHAVKIFSDVLGIEVKTKTEYVFG